MDCNRMGGGAADRPLRKGTVAGRKIAVAGLMVGALALGGCSGWGFGPNGGEAGDSPAESGLGKFFRGTFAAPKQLDTSNMQPITQCPPVSVRYGQQTYLVGAKGAINNPQDVRYQVSLTDTARECTAAGDNVQIKVGGAGRVLSGPKGGGGTVTFPVKYQVADSAGKMLYSKTFKVSATVDPTIGAVAWAYVDDGIVVPARTDLQIFVGFDVPAQKIPAAQMTPPSQDDSPDGGF